MRKIIFFSSIILLIIFGCKKKELILCQIEKIEDGEITEHDTFGGKYIAAYIKTNARIDTSLFIDKKNTFAEFADGTLGNDWIIWFPERAENDDDFKVANGDILSFKIVTKETTYLNITGQISGLAPIGYGSKIGIKGLEFELPHNLAFYPGETGYLKIKCSKQRRPLSTLLLFRAPGKKGEDLSQISFSVLKKPMRVKQKK